jgi:hypothetical protein
MDPFAAMSVLITLRTQLLLHHYRKLPIAILLLSHPARFSMLIQCSNAIIVVDDANAKEPVLSGSPQYRGVPFISLPLRYQLQCSFQG